MIVYKSIENKTIPVGRYSVTHTPGVQLSRTDPDLEDLVDAGVLSREGDVSNLAAEFTVADEDKLDALNLGQGGNVQDAEKAFWNGKQAALGFIPEEAANKGIAGGYASLNNAGKVPSDQLPSYIDDVLESATFGTLPTVGLSDTIYLTLSDDKTYRWSGSSYVQIATGVVDSVAGKIGLVTLDKYDVGLGNVDNTADLDKPISTATQVAINAIPAGVTAHGSLTGLGSDDHLQYHNDVRGDVRYSQLMHNHTGVYQPLSPVLTNTTASFTLANQTKLDDISVVVGATSGFSGTAGLVPAPSAGDEAKVLTGNGLWTTVPQASAFLGATAVLPGQAGLVPAPAVGDQATKFLKADGSWAPPTTPLEIYSLNRVSNATGQQVFTNTTAEAINLSNGSLKLNTGGFTPTLASGQVVVTTAGNYQLNFISYTDDAGGTASGLNVFLKVNGTTVAQSHGTLTDGYTGNMTISTVQVLSAGTILTLTASTTDGETVNLQGYDLSIIQIGIGGVAGGAGVSDHGALTGLADDDHTQYHTDARGDARYSLLAHDHAATYQPLSAVLTATTASFTTADETKLDGITTMVGATAVAAGAPGLVPAPAAGDNDKFLTGAGTYASPSTTALAYGKSIISATNIDVNVSAGAWQDTTFTMNLPSAGTYRLFWRATGEIQDDGTTEVNLSGRLRNNTNSTIYTDSRATIAGYDGKTAGTVSTVVGTGVGEVMVVVAAASTIIFQTRLSALASTSAVVLGDGNLRSVAYMSYEQIAGNSVISNPTVVADGAASGYFDIGDMRMVWGTFTQGSGATSVTLPASFADTSYVITGNVQDSTANASVYGTTFASKTTSTVSQITNAHNGTGISTSAGKLIGYHAFGRKP